MNKFLGIDLGGSNLRWAVVDGAGKVIDRQKETFFERNFSGIYQKLIEIIKANESIQCVGIGVPGPVKNERIVVCVNLNGFENMALGKMIEKDTGKSTRIKNDTVMALIGEVWMGNAQGENNVLLISLGTGVGSALMRGGKIIEYTKIEEELGHTIIDSDGPSCACGRRGCLEAYYKKRINQDRYLAQAIAEVCKQDHLDSIIIGGGVATAQKVEAINKELQKISHPGPFLELAKLGEWAGAIGAAKLAIDYGT